MTEKRLDRIEKLIKYDSVNCCKECGQYETLDDLVADAQGLAEELIAEVRRLRAAMHNDKNYDQLVLLDRLSELSGCTCDICEACCSGCCGCDR